MDNADRHPGRAALMGLPTSEQLLELTRLISSRHGAGQPGRGMLRLPPKSSSVPMLSVHSSALVTASSIT